MTGGGTGIGRQFTGSLAQAGAHVVVCGRRPEPLEQAVAEITDAGGAASAFAADVSSEQDVRRLADAAGPVDILVNNAGYGKIGAWTEVSPAQWREVMAVNVDAPFRLAQLLVPGMIERGWGRVINISSVMDGDRQPVLLSRLRLGFPRRT